jgi:hypothetical protein
MIAWIRLYADPGRTVIIAIKRTGVEMIGPSGDKGFMIFWYALLLGWIVCREQGVEKTMEFASTCETDITDLHGPIWSFWTWLPQGMSVRRIFDGKLFAEDVVVCHRESQESRNLLTPVGVRREVH